MRLFYNVYFVQVELASPIFLPKRQRLTKSLLSGSKNSFSSRSKLASGSAGGSLRPSVFSGPFMMRTADDAASVAIDFSKGHVEENAVDSPPNRGLVKTFACSPSPLKWASRTQGCSFSPTAQTEGATNWKLELPADAIAIDLRIEDAVLPSSKRSRPVHVREVVGLFASQGYTKSDEVRPQTAPQLPRLKDNGPGPSRSVGGRRVLSGSFLYRQSILREQQYLRQSRSTGTKIPYINSVNANVENRPPPRSTSQSTSEAARSTWKPERKEGDSQKVGFSANSGRVDTGGRHYHPSRREGLAKLRASKGANSNCIGEGDA